MSDRLMSSTSSTVENLVSNLTWLALWLAFLALTIIIQRRRG